MHGLTAVFSYVGNLFYFAKVCKVIWHGYDSNFPCVANVYMPECKLYIFHILLFSDFLTPLILSSVHFFPSSHCNKWVMFSFVHWLHRVIPYQEWSQMLHNICPVQWSMVWWNYGGLIVTCTVYLEDDWKPVLSVRSGMDLIDGQDAHLGSHLGHSRFSCCCARSRAVTPWLHLWPPCLLVSVQLIGSLNLQLLNVLTLPVAQRKCCSHQRTCMYGWWWPT
jgi:hypothetical protein